MSRTIRKNALAQILAIKPAPSEGQVQVSSDGAILRLTLSRPPANALSIEVMNALQAQLDRARDDASVRVIVLAAAPGKVFCAGHDLKEISTHRADTDRGRSFFEQTVTRCSALMQAIVKHPTPVIAEVDGLATAAGLQLVASCDLAVASDRATFCTPGVDIGLFCSTPMVALSRNVSRKHAMAMLLTGETIDAVTARDFGLVNRVAPPDKLAAVVQKFAQTIVAKSAATLRTGKAAFYQQAELPLGEAYEYASRIMVENLLARDAEEGIGAFMAKRAPKWHAE